MSLAQRFDAVRAQIAAACQRCGRDPARVALLAVSKTRPAELVRQAHALGQRQFGENRIQELVAKAAELADTGIRWHMIGSVQTNKVRDLVAVPGLVLLHALDRPRLADRLQAALAERGAHLDVLLQVNATGEPGKHGVPPGDAAALLDHVGARCPALAVRGLMAMGPLAADPAPVFAEVAALRERLQQHGGTALPVLSLGMTGDLEAAIANGSTLVRVGTGLFGPRA